MLLETGTEVAGATAEVAGATAEVAQKATNAMQTLAGSTAGQVFLWTCVAITGIALVGIGIKIYQKFAKSAKNRR